jgi:rhamnulokinase
MVQCRAAGDVETLDDIREVVRNSVELIEFEPTSLTYWQDAMTRFEQVCEKRSVGSLG